MSSPISRTTGTTTSGSSAGPSRTDRKDVALLVQIGTYERWDDLRGYAANFLGLDDVACDVYLNVVEDAERYPASRTRSVVADLERAFPDAVVTTTPNRGTDVGPFLRQLQGIVENGRSYGTIFKLHTKTVEPWTSDLCEIMESPDAIGRACRLVDERDDIGLVGSNRWLIPLFQGTSEAYQAAFRREAEALDLEIVDPGPEWRKEEARRAPFDWEFYVDRYRDLIPGGVDTEEKAIDHWRRHGIDELRVPNAAFVNELAYEGAYVSKLLAGTIFCCRGDALLPFFRGFDFDAAYWRLETGLVKDGNGTIPTVTHTWERLFGLIVESAGYRLYGV